MSARPTSDFSPAAFAAGADAASGAGLTWLDEHGDALYRYALPRVQDAHAAEDLVQETLLAALSARDRFTGVSSVRTWLIGILKHKIVDHLRAVARLGPAVEVDADADPFADFFDHRGRWKTAPARWQRDPAALAELAEFREVLARCLASLPRRIASLFWLREAEGKDTEQLCQELQVSATNVWTMLHRARARLRACLTANWFTRDVAP